MSDDCFALLEPDLRQVMLPQGAVCFGPGDPIDQVYFPHTGMISLVVVTGEGDMVETSSVGCEGAAGLQARGRSPISRLNPAWRAPKEKAPP